jgi:hypothetical protein
LTVKVTAHKLGDCPGYKLQFEKDSGTKEFKDMIEKYKQDSKHLKFNDRDLSMYVHFREFECNPALGNCLCHPCGCKNHTKIPIEEMEKEVDPTMEHMTALRQIREGK